MTEQDKLRLDAAEKLGYDVDKTFESFGLANHHNKEGVNVFHGEGKSRWSFFYSDSDLAEALRVMVAEQELDIQENYHRYFKNFMPEHDGYTWWFAIHCTPLQRIEAALQVLEE